jgi:hypothetical protein
MNAEVVDNIADAQTDRPVDHSAKHRILECHR